MIILNKKRLLAIMSMVCMSVFAFSFHIAKEETVQTVTLPVSGKTIVIDAGHGVPDEGAQSSNRHNRSTNKLENCFEIADIIRAKWLNCYFNKK